MRGSCDSFHPELPGTRLTLAMAPEKSGGEVEQGRSRVPVEAVGYRGTGILQNAQDTRAAYEN